MLFTKPTKDSPVLLLLDGHGSHKTIDAVEYARQHGVVMICFPPHTTHRLQPLDVTFFGPLKRSFHDEMDRWMVNNPAKRISDYEIAGIFAPAYTRCATMEKAGRGFSTTGIHPFNPNVFSDDDFAPSLTTELTLNTAVVPDDQMPMQESTSTLPDNANINVNTRSGELE